MLVTTSSMKSLIVVLAIAMGISESSAAPAVTVGDCAIDVRLQDVNETLVGVAPWHPDNNIVVKLAGSDCSVGVSPTWTIAGWENTIVQIAPNTVFTPPSLADNERQLFKLMRGTLIDVNLNGIFHNDRWETYTVTPANRAASMFVDSSVADFAAGAEGAVIVYMKVTTEILDTPATDMTAAPVTTISGPLSENLVWTRTPAEWGAHPEFWNLAGILMQENDGSRLAHMQWWTFREDGNADGYHDHTDLTDENAFGEMHMTMFVPNGVTGMQTTLPNTKNLNFKPNPEDTTGTGNSYAKNDQPEIQIAIPMPPGHAHGPLWSVDPATGEAARICKGGIQYPFHRMLVKSNGAANTPLRYLLWVAWEHLPEDVVVPLEMITEWPNAYLQSTMTKAQCDADAGTTSPPVAAPAPDGGDGTTTDNDDVPEDVPSASGRLGFGRSIVPFMATTLLTVFGFGWNI